MKHLLFIGISGASQMIDISDAPVSFKIRRSAGEVGSGESISGIDSYTYDLIDGALALLTISIGIQKKNIDTLIVYLSIDNNETESFKAEISSRVRL